MSKYMRLALIAGVVISCILLGLLVTASSNSVFFEKYYTILIFINAVVTLCFMAGVAALLYRIYKSSRGKKYGTKVLTKFVVALGLTGILPGILIFIVSVQFLHSSVDSWFDVKVERALDAGLTLGREVLEEHQSSLLKRAKSLAVEFAESPPAQWLTKLDEIREREGLAEAMLVTSRGRLLGVSAASFSKLVPIVPPTGVLQIARNDGYWAGIEEQESSLQAKILVSVPTVDLAVTSDIVGSNASRSAKSTIDKYALNTASLDERSKSGEGVFLELIENIPPSLAHNAEVLMNGYRDYQEMVFARSGLRTIYMVSLTLVLLLSMFASTAVSIIIAGRITQPLMLLLEGTRRVAEGKYEMVPEATAKDEVAELTRSFNIMISQLAQARNDIEKRGTELEQAKNYLERILSKMSSGVLVVDEQWKLISVNPSASRIMKTDLRAALGGDLKTVFPTFIESIEEQISQQKPNNRDIAIQCEVMLSDATNRRLFLFTRGTDLPLGSQMGYLLVFDDVSSLVAAQRTEAWGEVARRLAHEIKNPLTPIQLAAERLQMKLSGKVQGKEDEILQKATRTIVAQVTAMKKMVDDFRLYAKIGSPRYQKVDLSTIVEDVSLLYDAGGLNLKLNLQRPVPLIEADPDQVRQIIHNLVSNSVEASQNCQKPDIEVSVQTATDEKTQEIEGVSLVIKDAGSGFTNRILEHAFEPYVTTKSSGTGLGLAMIKKIVDEHRGTVTVENRMDKDGKILGAQVTIVFRQLC